MANATAVQVLEAFQHLGRDQVQQMLVKPRPAVLLEDIRQAPARHVLQPQVPAPPPALARPVVPKALDDKLGARHGMSEHLDLVLERCKLLVRPRVVLFEVHGLHREDLARPRIEGHAHLPERALADHAPPNPCS